MADWQQPHPLTGVVVLPAAGRQHSGASRHAHGYWILFGKIPWNALKQITLSSMALKN
jgi:hypothetical protein